MTDQATGDLYICWSPEAIYLGVYVIDAVETACYRDGKIPDADRAQWMIHIDGEEPITARVGAGRRPIVNDASIRVESISGVELDTRCIAIMEIPAERFKTAGFMAGDRVTFRSRFDTHGRAYRIEWHGDFTLAN